MMEAREERTVSPRISVITETGILATQTQASRREEKKAIRATQVQRAIPVKKVKKATKAIQERRERKAKKVTRVTPEPLSHIPISPPNSLPLSKAKKAIKAKKETQAQKARG